MGHGRSDWLLSSLLVGSPGTARWSGTPWLAPGGDQGAPRLIVRGAQPAAGLAEIDTIALAHVVDRVLPAGVLATAATPPASLRGLDAQAIAPAAERAGAGVLPTRRARDSLQPGVLPDQREQVDALLDDRGGELAVHDTHDHQPGRGLVSRWSHVADRAGRRTELVKRPREPGSRARRSG